MPDALMSGFAMFSLKDPSLLAFDQRRGIDQSGAQQSGLQPGIQVRHEKFGDGMVLMIEGQGDNTRVQINFADVGTKWILPAYAKLDKI